MTDNNNSDDKKSKKTPEWLETAKVRLPELIKKFFQNFKKSLAFAVIKAFLLIIVLTYIFFAFMPNQAFIAGDNLKVKPGVTSFESYETIFNSEDLGEISLHSEGAIKISLACCEIKGLEVSNPYRCWLVINPESFESSTNCNISITGNIQDGFLSNAFVESFNRLRSGLFTLSFVGPQELKIVCGRAVIETFDGEVIDEIDSKQITIIKRPYGIFSSPFFSWTPEDPEKYLVNIATTSHINDYFKHPDPKLPLIDIGLINFKGSITSRNIKHLETIVTGKISFSYTPTAQDYNLIDQELKLESIFKSHGELYLFYKSGKGIYSDVEGSECRINGYVTDGEISRMPLFPSFKTWFYSNAYIAPATIITIVIAATALFIKKNDKNE